MRKHRLKKVIALGIAGILTVGIAGCGSTTDTVSQNTDSNSEDCCTDDEDASKTDNSQEAVGDALDEEYGISSDVEELKIGVVSVNTRAAIPALASELGYFEEEGLDAELVHLDGTGAIISAMLEGKLDVCTFAAIPEINSIAAGNDIVFISGTGNADEEFYVKKEDVEYYSDINNLVGEKISISPGAEVRLAPKFEEAGLSPTDSVEYLYFDDSNSILQAISKGEVVGGDIVGDQREAAEKLGLASVYKFTDQICCRVSVTRDTLENKRSALLKYEIATIRAYEHYISDQEDTISVIAKYSQLDEDVVAGIIYTDGFISIDPNTKGIEDLYNYGYELGIMDEISDIDAQIDVSIYQDALTILLERDPSNAVYQELWATFQENNE